ncbi:DUF5682 family protein [Roseisolibacter agri]|uniref:DUF5682 family protein n=1 Tax=Roseisolibacter agri TaxID=2014610 RepID=UPI0024E10785|nr:DUF5682 family protein [Roseisolibacter agri]
MPADVRVFGIRHHGPGSARSLDAALGAFAPDVVLVEGPPEGDAVLALAAHPDMRPPVALLVYAADEPRQAGYWPFAVFSPEWIAVRHALARAVPVRFIDLPAAHQLALDAEHEVAHDAQVEPTVDPVRRDPLGALARAAGYADGERWWEHLVEERRDHAGVFDAVADAMTALRAATDGDDDRDATGPRARVEALREAWMRQGIRQATREGHARIAVVCGAWHVPALAAPLPPASADAALLRGLPKLKVQATWIPWTAARLARESGYGAGVASPGWYAHLWTHGAGADAATAWMTDAARLLRDEGLAASSAQVIDAVRLATTLGALRGRPVPGLTELTEAAESALVGGDATPMALVRDRLIVGTAIGAVPADAPSVPLQAALAREQKRLRLPPEALDRVLELDLRTPLDRDRSVLLHRLLVLDVPWGASERSAGKGTFKEAWKLSWRPELALAVIEAARWGNTVPDAAAARGAELAERAEDLPALARLLGRLLLADVPAATARALARLDALAAMASDVAVLADAIPSLARTLRYGDVRGTDRDVLGHVVAGLVARLAAGMPAAVASLDDDAARGWYDRLVAVDDAIVRLGDEALITLWREALARVLALPAVHGLVAGRACRLLVDAGAMTSEDTERRWATAIARGTDPAHVAAFIEGFLRDAGTLLVHDATLWPLLDAWLAALPEDDFSAALPLLRRTFATFAAPERRKLGERAVAPASRAHAASADAVPFDAARAAATLPTLALLLGVET